MDKIHFFLKLNPPRQSFTNDMSDQEKKIMREHAVYWSKYVNEGIIIVLGPVYDPKGGYGIAVAEVDSKEQLDKLIEKDPANGLNTYEVYPMRAVTNPQKK
jgi:uncharacterized protein YciI